MKKRQILAWILSFTLTIQSGIVPVTHAEVYDNTGLKNAQENEINIKDDEYYSGEQYQEEKSKGSEVQEAAVNSAEYAMIAEEETEEWETGETWETEEGWETENPSGITLSGDTIKNDFLSLVVMSGGNFTLGTQKGNLNSTTDDNKMLLFRWPYSATSNWRISVDGKNASLASWTNATLENGIYSESSKTYNGVSYQRNFRFVQSKTTGNYDVAQISLTVTNTSESEKSVGSRISMDTDVADNDAAPFYTALQGKFNTTKILTEDKIPQYWQVMNNLANPTVLAQGTFYRQLSERPDKVIFGSYGSLIGAWNPSVTEGSSNGDSAVFIRWDEKTLQPGESRTYSTWLGVGEMTQSGNDNIAISVNADTVGTVNTEHNAYNPIEVAVYMQNKGKETLTDLQAEIELPKGLSVAEGEDKVSKITEITSGDVKTAVWHVTGEPAESGAEFSYTILLKNNRGEVLSTIEKKLSLPVLDLVAPVITRRTVISNRASHSVDLALPEARDTNGIREYKVVCEELGIEETIAEKEKNTLRRYRGLDTGKDYEFRIYAIDSYGNMSEAQTVTVTASAPRWDGTSSTEKTGGRRVVQIEATGVCEDSEVVSEVFYFTQGGQSEKTVLPSHVEKENNGKIKVVAEWDLSTMQSGKYLVNFVMRDRDGTSVEKQVSYTVDNEPPKEITGLKVMGDYSGIRLSWNLAEQYKVRKYRIYRSEEKNGEYQELTTIVGRENISYEDTDVEASKTYFYKVSALDEYEMESQMCEAQSGTVKVDTEKPQIVRLTPASGGYISGKVKFSATAEDNLAVQSVCLQYKVNEEWVTFGECNGNICTAELDTTSVSDGKISIRATATDTSANISNGTPVYTYIVDNTAPEKVTGLKADALSTSITLNWDDVTAQDFKKFVLMYKYGDGEYTRLAEITNARGYYVTGLEPKTKYTFCVYAVDQAGNAGEYSDPLEVSTLSDTIAPDVVSFTPAASRINHDFELRISVKDNDCLASGIVQVSTDGVQWSDIIQKELSGKNAVMSCKISLSDYPEGEIYFRAILRDRSGNTNENSSDIPYVQYIIDRTPPTVPQPNVNAGDSWLHITWKEDTTGETAGYKIYRSDTEEGPYTILNENVQYLDYYDRTVQADHTYYYKVAAFDIAGNVSDISSAAGGRVEKRQDKEKPEILSVSPADNSVLSMSEHTISVLAKDNCVLDHVELNYGKKGLLGIVSEWKNLTVSGNGAYYLNEDAVLDMEGFETGDKIVLKITAFDAAGNKSDTLEYVYGVDITPPEISEVQIKLEDDTAAISWSSKQEEDLKEFTIYRSADSGVSWSRAGRVDAGSDAQYLYKDKLKESGSYRYKVEASDNYGNKAEEITATVQFIQREERDLVADFDVPSVMQVGVEYLFDGTLTKSKNPVTEWVYDFGDGSENSSERSPIHAFGNVGNYSVTLKVKDAFGNSDSIQKEITVVEHTSFSTLKVRITDDNGNLISDAPVYFDMNGENTVYYTDYSGYVTIHAKPGDYCIGSYKDGYLPVAKNLTLSGGTEREVTLTLVKQPIVTGNFEVHRMTLDQIEAAGIDTSKPENQNVIKMKVNLTYSDKPAQKEFIVNAKGDVIGNNKIIIGDREITIIPNKPDKGSKLEDSSKVIFALDLPVSASYLKEFFDVKLHIINNAGEGFNIKNNSLMLNVPKGMHLVTPDELKAGESTDTAVNGLLTNFESLKGGETKTLSWILRGDQEGDYQLSADYSGVLDKFEAEVNATFQSGNIHVYGNSAVKLMLNINQSVRYQAAYLDLGVKNVSNIDVNLPNIDIIQNAVEKAIVTAFKEKGQEESVADMSELSTWVENKQGAVQYFSEWPNENKRSLSGDETLFKRYAIYSVIDDDMVAYLRRNINVELENAGAGQVEVNISDFDLYPEDNAQAIMDVLKGNSGEARFLLDNVNYGYYTMGEEKSNFGYCVISSAEQLGDLIFNMGFLEPNADRKKYFRKTVAEFLQDEGISERVTERVDNTYQKAVVKTLDKIQTIAGAMQLSSDVGKTDLEHVFSLLKSEKNLNTLVNAAKEEGINDTFEKRVISLAGTSVGAVLVTAFEKNNSEIISAFSDGLKESGIGDVLDVIKTTNTVIKTWNDATEMATLIMQIRYARDEAEYILNLIEKEAEEANIKWMAEEAGKLKEEALGSQRDYQTEVISQFQSAFLKNGVKQLSKDAMKLFVKHECLKIAEIKMTEVVAKWGELSYLNAMPADVLYTQYKSYGKAMAAKVSSPATAYNICKLTFNIFNRVTGLDKWVAQVDNIQSSTLISAILEIEFYNQLNSKEQGHEQKALQAFKYLIKSRLVGERTYSAYQNASDKRKQKFEQQTGMTPDKYLVNQNKKILQARDTVYGIRNTQFEAVEAPNVTFDYEEEKTKEKFDNTYEYSIDDGESWSSCDGTSISVPGKNTGQCLYVRKKATKADLAGNKTALYLTARPVNWPYATGVTYQKGIYKVSGIKASTYYQFMVSDNDSSDINWGEAVLVRSDSEGNAVFRTDFSGEAKFLMYRVAATADSYAGQVAVTGIAEIQKVVLKLQTEGEVQIMVQDGEISIPENGELEFSVNQNVKLEAKFDGRKDKFLGWYTSEGKKYSEKEILEMEVKDNLSLTAKVERKPQYMVKLNGAEGLRLEGQGVYYEGESVTVRAYMDAPKTHKTFAGWYEGDTLRTLSSGYAFIVQGDRTLTAKTEDAEKARLVVNMNLAQSFEKSPEVVITDGVTEKRVTAGSFLDDSETYYQGDKLTLTANSTEKAQFVGWMNEGNQEISKNPQIEISLTGYNKYTAIYRQEGVNVRFEGRTGNVLEEKQYLPGTKASEINIPSIPYTEGLEIAGWMLDNRTYTDDSLLKETIAERLIQNKDIVIKATYKQKDTYVNIQVIDGSGSGRYKEHDAVTVRANPAPEGKVFSKWIDVSDGAVLSSSETYMFYASKNRTLQAVYTEDQEAEKLGVTYIESVTVNAEANKITFVSMSSVPEGCKIVKAGVIATSDSSIGEKEELFTDKTAMYVRTGMTAARNYRATWTKGKVTPAQKWYVRGYLVYTNQYGDQRTVYSGIAAADLNGTEDLSLEATKTAVTK